MKLTRLNSKSIFMEEEEISQTPLSKEEMKHEALKGICMTIGFYPDLRAHAKEVMEGIKKITDHISKKHGLQRPNIHTESILLEVRIKANNPTMAEYNVLLMGISPEDPRFPVLVKDFLQYGDAWSKYAKETYGINLSLNRSIPGGTLDPLGWKRDQNTGKLIYMGGGSKRGGMSALNSITEIFTFFKNAIEFGSYMWGVIEKLAKGESFSNISKFAEQYAKWRENPDEPFDIDPLDYLDDEERKAVEKIRNSKLKEIDSTEIKPSGSSEPSEPIEPTAKDADVAAMAAKAPLGKPIKKKAPSIIELLTIKDLININIEQAEEKFEEYMKNHESDERSNKIEALIKEKKLKGIEKPIETPKSDDGESEMIPL